MVESVDKQIEQRKETISDETNKDEMDINFKLLRTYFKLTSKVGPKMMDAIDNLKNELDIIEHNLTLYEMGIKEKEHEMYFLGKIKNKKWLLL